MNAARTLARQGMVVDLAEQALEPLIYDFVRVVDCQAALFCRADRASGRVVCSWGFNEPVEIDLEKRGARWRPRGGPPHRGGSFVGRALAHGRLAVEALDPLRDEHLINAADATLSHALAVPVRVPGGRSAALVAGFSSRPDPNRVAWLTDRYANLFALRLEAPDALAGLSAPTGRDSLTGCLSYQSTLHELRREINRSTRSQLSLSCCFIDLDHFKQVNDRYGHLRGNSVLARVAGILRNGVRSCDTVGRYGGDEFVAILPQTHAIEARTLAQRLAADIADARIPSLELPLTASIGVATWTPGTNAYQLLARADGALMAAKSRAAGVITADQDGEVAV